ncbi:hypothetical protein INS49_003964 [Diaporthe citri]|uniref:uncharacterized protein n=1 Tax=Diaporthe citri TaxID=83186 RepID=UPI001C825E75|nr:uncharacterized protein INS49_003964 [Diaporthe citri]KAG6354883.1 hypothetical protein INS49_003964 [Diaporthe citri]
MCQAIWQDEPNVLSDDEEDIPKNWKSASGALNAGNQISSYWKKANGDLGRNENNKGASKDVEDTEAADKAEKAADKAEKAADEAEKAAHEAEKAAHEAETAAMLAGHHAKSAMNSAKDIDKIAKDMKNDEYTKKAKDMNTAAEDAKKAAEKAKKAAREAKKAAEDAKKARDAKNAEDAQQAAQYAKTAAEDGTKANGQAYHLANLAMREANKAKEAAEAAKPSPKVKTDPDAQQAIPDSKVKLEYPDLLDDALELFSNLTLDNNKNLEVEDFGSKGEPDEIYFFRDPFTGLGESVKGNILFTPMNGKCFGFALPTEDGKFKFGFAPVTGQYEKKYLQFQTAYGNNERSRVVIMSKDRELRTLGFDDLAQLQYIGTGYMLPPSGIPSDRIIEEDENG